MNSQTLTLWDWLITPLYILIILVIASNIQKGKIKNNPIYKYYVWGLFAKIVGAISLCLIYVYYYKGGGDTIGYHEDAQIFINLFFDSPSNFFNTLLNLTPKDQQYYYFNSNTGFPGYWPDPPALNTVRFITPIEMFGLRSYLASSVLMAVLSFSGVWKLYTLFSETYPNLYKQFAISILFVPSVLFWGSGLLKDSLTLAAACWYCYSTYKIFIVKREYSLYILSLFISIFVMVAIKPYIFVALLPGSILWIMWSRIGNIKNGFLRILVTPLIIVVGVSIGMLLWGATSSDLGDYSSVDSMIIKANSSYEDLKMDYYHGNSFDLGSYDASISGIISKFPIGTMTGLFRPFLWEAKNPVMIISGLENLIILSMTLYFLVRRPVSFVSSLFSNPMVLFCMIFGVLFAFSVAISTSNFGALVRLRIPAIPFFLTGLVLVEYLSREKEKNKSVYSSRKVEYTN